MHRFIFWGVILLVVALISLAIDQVFYRTIRLFLSRHTAQVVRLCLFLAVVTTLTAGYLIGHHATRLQIEVKRTVITSDRLPASFAGYKVAHISDFHIGSFDPEADHSFFTSLANLLQQEKPNLLVFTGDMVTARSAEALPFRRELSMLAQAAGVPVYSVLGNHDYADYMRDFTPQRRRQDRDSLVALQQGAGWQMLNNASTYLHRGQDSILLVGVENIGEPPFSVYGDLQQAMSPMGGLRGADSTFTMLLSHNPTHWRKEVIPDTQIDLTLSGHTHAMQFQIGSWSPSAWKYPEWEGLYREGQQYLYVNTGLGCVGPAVRVGIHPELTIITLQRGAEQ